MNKLELAMKKQDYYSKTCNLLWEQMQKLKLYPEYDWRRKKLGERYDECVDRYFALANEIYDMTWGFAKTVYEAEAVL